MQNTRMFKQGRRGAALHDLEKLREASAILEDTIKLDRTGKLKSAWTIIVSVWQKDELRYGRELGHKAECERFLKAVEELHPVILRRQGERL